MLFCIPLLPKERSHDWSRVGSLLSDTFRSLANQRSRRFEVLLCAHEVPDNLDTHGVPLHHVAPDWKPDEQRRPRADKDWKIRLLGAEARRRGGGFVMQLDADDLLSDRLVEHVYAADDPNGYVLDTGYLLDRETGAIAPVPGAWPEPFDFYCGSCAVFRMTPDDLPRDRFEETSRWTTLGGHHFWKKRARKAGRPLAPFPFPAAIYVQNNGENLQDRREATRNEFARTCINAAALADTTVIRREFALSA